MSAVRHVLNVSYIILDPEKTFNATLPPTFLVDEPRAARLTEIWNRDVRETVNDIFRFRRSARMNRNLRKTIFEGRLHGVCDDFSRRTENVKVYFQKAVRVNAVLRKKETELRFRVTQLTPLDPSQRNVAFCLAEIPQPMPEVQAELVGTTDDEGTAIADNAAAAVTARTEIVSESAFRVASGYNDNGDDGEDYIVNPPLASEVTAIVEDEVETDDNDPGEEPTIASATATSLSSEDYTSQSIITPSSERSALGRMQELESIRAFLSDEEYRLKRKDILDSI